MSGRAILERRIVHVPDLLAEPEYQGSTAVVGGFRSNLAVPMMLEGEPIGVIVINRMRARPVLGQADLRSRDLCRPGRDRDRERAAVHGAGGAEP